MQSQYDFNKTFENIEQLQQRTIKSFQVLAGAGAANVETLTRKNYAFAGELLDYSIKQLKRPIVAEKGSNPLTQQLNETAELQELFNRHGAEYVDVARQIQTDTQKAVEEAAAVARAA